MSDELEEYEKHIQDGQVLNSRGELQSLCAAPLVGWYFKSVSHAFNTRRNEGRLLVCPACLEIVNRAFAVVE